MSRKVKVELLPKDFENNIFNDISDCPLHRAVQRYFKLDKDSFWLGVEHGWKLGDLFYPFLTIVNPREEWNEEIAERVRECYARGDETRYYVTVMTKEEMIEFLRENLTLEIKQEIVFSTDMKSVEIKLKLEGEVISSDSFYVPS